MWPNEVDQAPLLAVAAIPLVGWGYPQPSEGVFEIVEGLDQHAAVHCDRFAKPLGVKHRFFKHICELCGRRHTSIFELQDCVGRELAIVEPIQGVGISRQSPAIEEYFLHLVPGNRLQQFQKGPLRLLQRKLPHCVSVKAT